MATEAISRSEAAQRPMIAVPEALLLTTEVATERLGPLLAEARQPERRRRQPWWALGRQQQQDGDRLDPTLLLALLLATERGKGPASYWQPYIAALPEEPPCGWALGESDLAAALATLGRQADGWEPLVRAAAAAVQQQCDAAAGAYGPALGVTAADVRWALGQVVSRAFGSGDDLALLPLIDSCNHGQFADQPDGCAVWGAGTREKRELGSFGDAVLSTSLPLTNCPAPALPQAHQRSGATMRGGVQPAARRSAGAGSRRRVLHFIRCRVDAAQHFSQPGLCASRADDTLLTHACV